MCVLVKAADGQATLPLATLLTPKQQPPAVLCGTICLAKRRPKEPPNVPRNCKVCNRLLDQFYSRKQNAFVAVCPMKIVGQKCQHAFLRLTKAIQCDCKACAP